MSDLACPPPSEPETVTLAHGGGGRMAARLIDRIFRPALGGPHLDDRHDGAALDLAGPVAFSTDSYVVTPLEFPGGDIGTLAVNGTVNDLAMCGARPRFLSAGFVLEEGLALATLARIVASMGGAARAAGVEIATADLKVVERGKADGMFVTTTGVGEIVAPAPVRPAAVRPGDAVILSGDIGRHGVAVMAARAELGLDSPVESDCAPLAAPVLALFAAGLEVHCLRDLTRGGLATGLVEIAETAGCAIGIEEAAVPVAAPVQAVCELLGLEVLQVANEGRFVLILPAGQADRALRVLRAAGCAAAVRIGTVDAGRPRVVLRTAIGARRVLDMPSGLLLPRIC